MDGRDSAERTRASPEYAIERLIILVLKGKIGENVYMQIYIACQRTNTRLSASNQQHSLCNMGSFSARYKGVTPYMVFCCVVYLSGALLYGIDTGSFGSLQALPSFRSKFGEYNAKTKAYALPSDRAAAMNSIPFAGQALGALLSSFVVDWFGYV